MRGTLLAEVPGMDNPAVRYVLKFVISATLIVLASEIARRSTVLGALIISLPLVSYLGIIWLYVDTKDTQQVAALSWDIIWLVLPSLSLFAALPLLLRWMNFTPALLCSTLIMFAFYGATMWIVHQASTDVVGE